MGKYPPSREQVLTQFYGYHKKMQAATNGTSSKKISVSLVAEDIERWWDNTGIKIKANCTINESVNKLLASYVRLQTNKDRGNKDQEHRDAFLNDIQDTMWVVTKETEDTLANSTSAKKQGRLGISSIS